MSVIKVHDKYFDIYLSEDSIQKRVKEITASINIDYKDKKPLFIAILNGSFMFAADIFKNLEIEAEICFIKLISYQGTKSTGNVVTSIGLMEDVHGRDVILIEDIVDTGKTLHDFLPGLMHQQPASMKIAALLHKPDATAFPLTIDYLAFSIPNKFVIGYGLDYNGLGRNLRSIYQLA
jgi:hypoxanthine phosphoribosyltransferase